MIIAIVGMTGSGKSTVADIIAKNGFQFLRLGQITLDIVRHKGIEPTEENERPIREGVRKEHGMAAYAILNFPKIDEMLKTGSVVADGLYSWEEYLAFKGKYGDDFLTLAVQASPETRYSRLATRTYDAEKDTKMRCRPHSRKDAKSRDQAEIENLHKGGPIAMADFTIINEGTLDELAAGVKEFLESSLLK